MSDQIESLLQFKDYEVCELQYKQKLITKETPETFNYEPVFSRKIDDLGNGNYSIILEVIVGTKKGSLPFSAKVVIKGFFHIENEPDAMQRIELNGTSILFPYLRSTLTTLTSLSNIPSLILPTFNIAQMFKDSGEKSVTPVKRSEKQAGKIIK